MSYDLLKIMSEIDKCDYTAFGVPPGVNGKIAVIILYILNLEKEYFLFIIKQGLLFTQFTLEHEL